MTIAGELLHLLCLHFKEAGVHILAGASVCKGSLKYFENEAFIDKICYQGPEHSFKPLRFISKMML